MLIHIIHSWYAFIACDIHDFTMKHTGLHAFIVPNTCKSYRKVQSRLCINFLTIL